MNSVLIGCMVGPNFHSPCPPATKSYTKSPLRIKTASISASGQAGRAQYFIPGKDLSGEWWTLFHSKSLNDLIDTGIANSANLAAAQGKLVQAQETLNAQVGTLLFPAVSAQLGGQRQRFSDSTFGVGRSSIFNLFNATVNVAYTLDVFGGSRRQIEATAAQVDYQQYVFIGTYLTLTSNIATTAISVAALESQIKATRQIIRSQEDLLSIIEKQFQLGGASSENILSQQTLLAQTRALLPPLQKNLALSRHALAVLVGSLPSESQLPEIKLDQLNLPKRLPVSLPSKLVRQRPDVQAQEALLHQASAQIGVATANLFPQITLNGSYGWTSNIFNMLLSPHVKTWSYGTSITEPIFNGGALMAQRRAAIAAFDAAYAQYRQTVLQAFQNVADSLRAIQEDAHAFRAQTQAEIAASKTLALTRKQYRLGAVSYLSLLNAQVQYQQTVINRVQAQAARYNDTVALFQALGGGWWNRGCI